MKWLRLTAALLPAMAGAAENTKPEEPHAPTDVQLFLVLGLPNLPARGRVEKIDREQSERVLVMNREFGWSRAIYPEDWSPAELTVVELASMFAHTVSVARLGQTLGLLPAVFGGESLADWMPGTPLYQAAIERTRIAQKDGKLAGILWVQGPTKDDPAKTADYAKRFAAMIAQLRIDLGVKYVPVIVGELKPGATGAALATSLAEVPQQVIPCLFVSTEGVPVSLPGNQLDSQTMWAFSAKLAQAWMDLAQP